MAQLRVCAHVRQLFEIIKGKVDVRPLERDRRDKLWQAI